MNATDPLSLDLNQSSLQDFLDCPRRFELSALQELHWPAAHSAPLAKFEGLTELGSNFHHLCHQFFLGIDADLISSSLASQEIQQLWKSFLPFGKSLLPYPRYFEQILRIPFKNHFLVGKFDLIVQRAADDFLIIDWKTASNKPSRTVLANRVQTFLYPLIFQKAGGDLFGSREISPAEITMQYWYPLSSDPEEVFPYSETVHQEVLGKLSDHFAEIEKLIESDQTFPLTDDHERCTFCIYRSYCERGHQLRPVPPGADLEGEDLSNVHFDLEIIKEIEF